MLLLLVVVYCYCSICSGRSNTNNSYNLRLLLAGFLILCPLGDLLSVKKYQEMIMILIVTTTIVDVAKGLIIIVMLVSLYKSDLYACNHVN